MRKPVQIIVAIILIALGALWSLQGVGVIGGSFMSGDRTWLVIGVVLLAAGLVLIAQTLRRG